MKAVILAAGIASRLRPLTDTTPKCLLKIGERCLLERAFDALIQNGARSRRNKSHRGRRTKGR